MKWIKKNKLLCIALIGYTILALTEISMFLDALNTTKYYVIEMLQILPAVFILTSMIQTWVPTKTIVKYFGKTSGIKGYGVSFLIGSLSAGPIYAAFPVCQTLLKKGASIKNIIVILSAWAVVKVPMLINEVKFMGLDYMLVRWVLTLIVIIVMAEISDRVIKVEDIKMTQSTPEVNHAVCILCEKCLKSYPDLFYMNNGKIYISDSKQVTDAEREICPVGAIS